MHVEMFCWWLARSIQLSFHKNKLGDVGAVELVKALAVNNILTEVNGSALICGMVVAALCRGVSVMSDNSTRRSSISRATASAAQVQRHFRRR